ncbi:MAG: hypothetical protein QNJ97_00515 [Myxococcota bacterium]|nr:hypothetical protein [Myxococcota bacterium]
MTKQAKRKKLRTWVWTRYIPAAAVAALLLGAECESELERLPELQEGSQLSALTHKYSQLMQPWGSYWRWSQNGGQPLVASGAELPDFSYAGAINGTYSIPQRIVTVTHDSDDCSSYNDQSPCINAWLQEASDYSALLLKAGVYKIRNPIVIPPTKVLRGEVDGNGVPTTKIWVDLDGSASEPTVGQAYIVGYRGPTEVQSWGNAPWVNSVQGDVAAGSVVIPVKYDPGLTGITTGDFVSISQTFSDWNDRCNDFVKLYNTVDSSCQIDGQDIWNSGSSTIAYLRQVQSINRTPPYSITISHPIRHLLRWQDHSHVRKITFMAQKVGLENIKIGFTPTHNWDTDDCESNINGCGTEQTYAAARAVFFGNVINGWIKNVHSYDLSYNPPDLHLHSRGIELHTSQWVTVENTSMQQPAHVGGGGNGYLYTLTNSGDCLVNNATAVDGRHNFLFYGAGSTGNVITSGTSTNGKLTNDSHFAMAHANLVERFTHTGNVSTENAAFTIANRYAVSNGAGQTGADFTFWNVSATKPVKSRQATANAWGYVIGASSADSSTSTEWREHIGINLSELQPQSLWWAQYTSRRYDKSNYQANTGIVPWW